MSLKRNLIANYLGQVWIGLIGLAFVPLYIKYLGMEAYGLIGVFVLLQAWLALLDLGMSPTLNREVARFSAGAHSVGAICDLIRTFEIICAAMALIISIVFVSLSDWFSLNWLNVKDLPEGVVSQVLSIMGGVASLRFIEGLYRGAMLGFQRHVWLNVVTAVFATIRALGALGVLVLVEPSIQAFFWWQLFISGIMVLVLHFGVWAQLPGTDHRPTFSHWALSTSWKFAGGVFFTTLLSLLITQIDKVLLSRLLSLEAFGVYAFSAALAGVLFQVIGPIAQSYYPKLTELVTSSDGSALSRTYHQAAQLMTIALVPVGFILIVFGEPLIFAWTGNQALANQASIIVACLAIGTIFNGWMHIPYMLQLASGWSMFSVWVNLVAAIILVPAIFWVTPRFGPVGAACVWVLVNAGYVLFSIHLMHVRLLPSEKMSWYVRDLAIPTLVVAAVMGLSNALHPSLGRIGEFIWVGVTGLIAWLSAILAASEFRHLFFKFFRRNAVPI